MPSSNCVVLLVLLVQAPVLASLVPSAHAPPHRSAAAAAAHGPRHGPVLAEISPPPPVGMDDDEVRKPGAQPEKRAPARRTGAAPDPEVRTPLAPPSGGATDGFVFGQACQFL